MTWVAAGFRPARSSTSFTGTPVQVVSSFDQRVTQWMSSVTSRCGSAISSSHESFSSFSTSPKTVRSQVARSYFGFGPTVRTGKRSVRYWPGGTRAGIDAQLLRLLASARREHSGGDRHRADYRIGPSLTTLKELHPAIWLT